VLWQGGKNRVEFQYCPVIFGFDEIQSKSCCVASALSGFPASSKGAPH
jgi:hypothetical protein